MKVLGIEIAGKEIRWLIVDGDVTAGTVQYLSNSKVGFPQSGRSVPENYKLLQQIVVDVLKSENPDKVAIIKSIPSSGVDRAKVECIIECACGEADVSYDLIAPNSVTHVQKNKFMQVVGSSVASSYGDGNDIKPKYLERAFYCAWKSIHG